MSDQTSEGAPQVGAPAVEAWRRFADLLLDAGIQVPHLYAAHLEGAVLGGAFTVLLMATSHATAHRKAMRWCEHEMPSFRLIQVEHVDLTKLLNGEVLYT